MSHSLQRSLPQSLIQEGEADYALAPDVDEIWIKIEDLILHIVKSPEGLLTETFRAEASEDAHDEPVAFSYTTFGKDLLATKLITALTSHERRPV